MLEDFGYNNRVKVLWQDHHLDDFEPGRVLVEHKERYVVRTEDGEIDAEITGNMRFSARDRADFPAVGDWVAITPFGDDAGIIQQILPRKSMLSRQAVGQSGELQVIAANVDVALIVQAVDRDFNINRLERYLTICYSSKVTPVIVFTKTDLVDIQRITQIREAVESRIPDVKIFTISNQTQDGMDLLKHFVEKGITYCLLGSSGVGKSSLLNNLTGDEKMKTGHISHSNSKGRHVTSHRELTVLPNGGILIDNPGMREVGIIDSGEGLENTFDKIFEIAEGCRFKDCTHTTEVGCAVLEALQLGELDQDAYDNFQKMERERSHYESTVAERRMKDKNFGKMIKDMKKNYSKK